MRTLSTMSAMLLMRYRSADGSGLTGDSDTNTDGTDPNIAAGGARASIPELMGVGVASVTGRVKAAWEGLLEVVFKAMGDELALAGLRVARGEELSEADKERIRELVAEVCLCVYVCARARACVRACVCVCVFVCVSESRKGEG